jgi:hypothetical protein
MFSSKITKPEILTGYNLITIYGNATYVPRPLYANREEMLRSHANLVAGDNGYVVLLSDIFEASFTSQTQVLQTLCKWMLKTVAERLSLSMKAQGRQWPYWVKVVDFRIEHHICVCICTYFHVFLRITFSFSFSLSWLCIGLMLVSKAFLDAGNNMHILLLCLSF